MPLTPEDVANKQFSSVRLREGYDMEEVDQFLDEVEQEIARLVRENDDLRGRLAAADRAVSEAEGKVTAAERRATEAERKAAEAERKAAEAPSPAAAPTPTPAPTPAPAPAPAPVRAPAAKPAEMPSESAAGILALAQRTADEHMAEARSQADKIVGEARTRADAIAREAEDKRRQTLGSLEREKADIERRIEQLKTFEREYRTRLRSYLEGQLRELDRHAPIEATAGASGQSRPGQGGGGQES